MSQNNRYPLTQPSQELTQDVTAALKLPYSRVLQAHLGTCQECDVEGQGFCPTAHEMLQEAKYLAHRETCEQCHLYPVCEEGWAIFNG